MITRDPSQSQDLVRLIRLQGGETLHFPTIRITEPADWSACDEAIEKLDEYDWIVISSTNGADYFLQRCSGSGKSMQGTSIAAVGEKTAERIRKYGYKVDLLPPEYNAESLIEAFRKFDLHGKKVLWPTSDLSRDKLPEGLSSRGAYVKKVTCYRTEKVGSEKADEVRALLADDAVDVITFYRPSSFHSFLRIFEDKGGFSLKKDRPALAAIGPVTARAIHEKGFPVHILPEQSVAEELVKAIIEYFNE